MKAFLVIEKGEPYKKGKIVPLPAKQVFIGRQWGRSAPDIAFESPYISRRHAELDYKNNRYYLKDLPDSKHGAKINGRPVKKEIPYALNHMDSISLSNDEVIFTFCCESAPGSTFDFVFKKRSLDIILDEENYGVSIDGCQIALSGKFYELFRLLYGRKNHLVKNNVIKKKIWPERELGLDGLPIVADEEVKTLVFRLREKLGVYENIIETVRKLGYKIAQNQ